MQVFVSEYVCGGAWGDTHLPASLEREGRAMLRAIVSDFARIPGCEVTTTLDDRRPPLGIAHVTEIRVNGKEEEERVFLDLAARSDACLVIAPELGDALTKRCRAVEVMDGVRLLNPAADVTRLCSDKLAFARFLQERNLPTIATSLLGGRCQPNLCDGPVVVKPRFGAGSQGVHALETLEVALGLYPVEVIDDVDGLIVQPLVSGTAISVGVIFSPTGEGCEVMPTASQHLADDGTFAYLGGTVPAETAGSHAVREIVKQVCKRLPGLRGYVGFDLLVPFDAPDRPLIVEINPRLTTSYLGYRQLTDENLAARMLSDAAWTFPLSWKSQRVVFSPDGEARTVDEGFTTATLSPRSD